MDKKEAFEKELKKLKPTFRNTMEESWNGIQERIAKGHGQERRGRMAYVIGAAAAVAVMIGAAWWVQTPASKLRQIATTEIDKPLRIELPDGSVVMLNDNSVLTFDETDFENARTVRLKGQAYFDVKKSGADFTVITDQGSVAVLGTTFDVFSADRWFEVHCFSGKVAVNNPVSAVTLSPGNSAVVGPNGRLSSGEISAESPAWADGEFSYTDKPLERVWVDVEQQYGVKIKYLGDSGRTFTGYFSEDFSLNETLEIICRPMGLTYQVNDKQVEIMKVPS